MHTTEQGRVGEAKVVAYLVERGYDVFMPIYGNATCDLIITKPGKLARVQVKSTNYLQPSGKYRVELKSTRSNRTANTVKKFDASLCDYLAIYYVALDKVDLLPAVRFDGKTAVHLLPEE